MTPEQLAKSGSEHAHQRAFFAWLNTWNREVWEHTFAIPNGGARGDDHKARRIRGAILKAEGVKRGVPDIMCAWPKGDATGVFFAGLFIEMKKVDGGVTSDEQKDWHKRLSNKGYRVVTCYNWMEAANAFARYFRQSRPFSAASDGESMQS